MSAAVGLNSGVRSTGSALLLPPTTNEDVSARPLNTVRLQQQVHELVEREQRDGLALRQTVHVFEQAPRIKRFTPEDNLRFGPTPFTAPMDNQMVRIVWPP